mgnify:CR=1 FL=1
MENISLGKFISNRRKELNVIVDKLFVGMFQNAVANITIEYATTSKQGSVSATKKQLTDGGLELVIPGLTAPDENISIVLSYTYTTTGWWSQTYTYISNTINTTVGNLMNAQISGITFTQQ